MSKNPFQFSLEIRPRWMMITGLAIAPGFIMSLLTLNPMWLVSSFLSAAGVLPYSSSHSSRKFALLNIVIICSMAYIIKGLFLNHHWIMLLTILVVMALIMGFVDNEDPHYRSLSTWLIIGSVYGGAKLNEVVFSYPQLMIVIALAVLGVVLVLIFIRPDVYPKKPTFISYHHPSFIFNFKYVLPVIITTSLWYAYNIQDPEWFIWSSLTVVFTQFDTMFLKYQHRIIGVSFGVLAGILVSMLLPHSLVITYICFIGTMFSLRSLKDYLPAHVMRCFIVVVFAGNVEHQSVEAAIWRFSNVIIGGTIGFLCTLALMKLHLYLIKRSLKNS